MAKSGILVMFESFEANPSLDLVIDSRWVSVCIEQLCCRALIFHLLSAKVTASESK